MSYYIALYKGGRGGRIESFMYGCDKDTNWLDLTTANTTGMTNLPLQTIITLT